jgi:hypothetical protein
MVSPRHNRPALSLLLFVCGINLVAAQSVVVTRMDDDPATPQRGSLRWAVAQPGVSHVSFAKAGDVSLRAPLPVSNHGLTIDGSSAPGQGICIRGGTVELHHARDCTLRYLRIRLGDENVRAANKRLRRPRPTGSNGLDCLNLLHCRSILVEHCSFSWSCDELISVVHCRDVTLRHCLLAEPLGHPRLHPYGDHHAFGLNASASTLHIEHCLFSHYYMRGPQFEANDMRHSDKFNVRMTAQYCLMHNYVRSAARYTTGVEDHKDQAQGKRFDFRFKNNLFVDPEGPGVEPEEKHGHHPGVRVTVWNNQQLSHWASSPPWERLLESVGCSHRRDSADTRVIASVRKNRFPRPIQSQASTGGWPDLRSPDSRPPNLALSLFPNR